MKKINLSSKCIKCGKPTKSVIVCCNKCLPKVLNACPICKTRTHTIPGGRYIEVNMIGVEDVYFDLCVQCGIVHNPWIMYTKKIENRIKRIK